MCGVVSLVESNEEARQCNRVWWKMITYFHLSIARNAWFEGNTTTGVGIFNPQHGVGQTSSEFAMKPQGICAREGVGALVVAFVNGSLDFNVCDGLKL
jgi:hypothetical protein